MKGKYRTNIQTLIMNPNTGEKIDSYYSPGDMHISGESLHPHYIYSLSDGNINVMALAKKFNKRYCIIINEIAELGIRLNKKKHFEWQIHKIKLDQVKYDREGYVEIQSNQTLPYSYNYLQKSPSFSDEHEWRFVLTGTPDRSDKFSFVNINIGSINDITTALNL